MRKTYIIYYEWPSTAGNHAGMAYLFRKLKEWNKKNVRLIKIPTNISKWNSKIHKLYIYMIIIYLYVITTGKNNIFITEYLCGLDCGNLPLIAKKLQTLGTKAQLYGLAHLSEKHLLEIYGSDERIKNHLKLLDKIVVFGSSLSEYFNRLGFDEDKVIVTFHYVENSFYKPIEKTKSQRIKAIAMGNLKRNFENLKAIIASTQNVDYHICMGNAKLEDIFSEFKNVTLYGFLNEDKFLHLMQQSDVSISVLEDTVGSNVITTSLATGLVQIVSDVGSIRDYLNESNAFICKNNNEFICALKSLEDSPELLEKMSSSALKQSETFEIKKFNEFFVELMS